MLNIGDKTCKSKFEWHRHRFNSCYACMGGVLYVCVGVPDVCGGVPPMYVGGGPLCICGGGSLCMILSYIWWKGSSSLELWNVASLSLHYS